MRIKKAYEVFERLKNDYKPGQTNFFQISTISISTSPYVNVIKIKIKII